MRDSQYVVSKINLFLLKYYFYSGNYWKCENVSHACHVHALGRVYLEMNILGQSDRNPSRIVLNLA